MIDPAELNARGVRARVALNTLQTLITAPQQALAVAYAAAVFSNLMRALEQDAGVVAGYFGSSGAELPEINPFTGVPMPQAVSHEPPPFFTGPSPAPLNPSPPTDPFTPPSP